MADRKGARGPRKPTSHRDPGRGRSEKRDPRTARSGRRDGEESREVVHLDDAIVSELRATARPGKGEILVKVFADAVTAFAQGDLEEAVRLGEQSKHIALRAASIRELLGIAYYQAGRWQEAARELSTFRRISGTTEQNPVIADCYRALEKPQKALELCDEIDPRKVEAPVFFEGEIVAAGALSDMGKLDEAIERLGRLDLDAAVAEEHHVRAWYALADLFEKRGRFTQARRWFEAVVAVDEEMTDAPDRLRKLRGSIPSED